MTDIQLKSNWGLGTQDITVFNPSDVATGQHPVLIIANGTGEVGTKNSAPGSIGAQLRAGAQLKSFIVIELHKPFGGVGNFEKERYKDGIDYALTLPQADPSRIYVTGLSLSGGGVWALMADAYAAKIAAAAPICGVGDVPWQTVFDNVLKTNLPFTTVDSVDDENPQTKSAYEMYHMGRDIKYGKTLPDSSDVRFIRPLTGGHGGSWQKAYDMGHISFPIEGNAAYTNNPNLFEWFLTKTRAVAAAPPASQPVTQPAQPTPPPAKSVVQTIIIPAKTIKVYSDNTYDIS